VLSAKEIVIIHFFYLDVTELDVSKQTVLRRLKELDILPYIPAKKEYLSPSNIRDRLAFAVQYGDHDVDWWKTRTVFTDESTIGYVIYRFSWHHLVESFIYI